MKKKAALVFWIFVASLVSAANPINAKAQFPDASMALQALALQLTTPEVIAKFIWKNFSFERDQHQFGREEYWQAPEELLKNKKGDCEDFARFAAEILKLNGVNAFLMNIYGGRFSHTVCVFKEGDSYNVIDGTSVKRFHSKNLNEIASNLYAFWNKAAIVAPAPETKQGSILTEFSRRMKVQQTLATFS